jgi:hypothetical protein
LTIGVIGVKIISFGCPNSIGGIVPAFRRKKKKPPLDFRQERVAEMLTLEAAIDAVLKGSFTRVKSGLLVVATDEALLPPAYIGRYGRVCVAPYDTYRDDGKVFLRQHLATFEKVRSHVARKRLTAKIVVHPPGHPDVAKVFQDLATLKRWSETPTGRQWYGSDLSWFFAISA